jgi:hypothetical protein
VFELKDSIVEEVANLIRLPTEPLRPFGIVLNNADWTGQWRELSDRDSSDLLLRPRAVSFVTFFDGRMLSGK